MFRFITGLILACALFGFIRCGAPQTRVSGAGEGQKLGAGTHVRRIAAAGHRWNYSLHVPATSEDQALPLVLVLHGAGGAGERYLDANGWRAKADAAGFAVLAPDGLPARPNRAQNFFTNPRLWNTGQLDSRSPRAAIDDLAFFDALLDEVSLLIDVDPRRVYVCGHSNGAGMTYRLAAERSQRFAAAGMVNGFCWIAEPAPSVGVPSIAIHGELDPLVPINGGEARLPWGTRTMEPVRVSLDRWATGLGCAAPPIDLSNQNRVRVEEYRGCRDGALFRVLYIADHGHGWPGGAEPTIRRWQGAESDALNATDALWEFFESKSR